MDPQKLGHEQPSDLILCEQSVSVKAPNNASWAGFCGERLESSLADDVAQVGDLQNHFCSNRVQLGRIKIKALLIGS